MDEVNYAYRCLNGDHVFTNVTQQLTCENCSSS